MLCILGFPCLKTEHCLLHLCFKYGWTCIIRFWSRIIIWGDWGLVEAGSYRSRCGIWFTCGTLSQKVPFIVSYNTFLGLTRPLEGLEYVLGLLSYVCNILFINAFELSFNTLIIGIFHLLSHLPYCDLILCPGVLVGVVLMPFPAPFVAEILDLGRSTMACSGFPSFCSSWCRCYCLGCSGLKIATYMCLKCLCYRLSVSPSQI
ncbi:hypothetical protein DPMN_166235 [Dreissena polymorpha]|uniref:Uncharacterized protein n=1 Tax=Dreissena polymorpha TaxID=45954 RepID=A0A9D4IX75_DREPO|nr:hypothetical protein DPMN_166235 [Dreissena polymorpha]